ncbi:MAG: thymidylate kinase [Geminicoccaceae bacterium]
MAGSRQDHADQVCWKSILRGSGHDVMTTREPGGTPGAEQIRGLVTNGSVDRWHPMTELLLMMAARSSDRCRAGPAAIADRGLLGDQRPVPLIDRVYQGLAGGLGLDVVDRLYEPLLVGTLPDLTLVLDCPSKPASPAAMPVAVPDAEAKDHAFHETVRKGFLELSRREPVASGCSRYDPSVAAVARQIRDAVDALEAGTG